MDNGYAIHIICETHGGVADKDVLETGLLTRCFVFTLYEAVFAHSVYQHPSNSYDDLGALLLLSPCRLRYLLHS